jgi:hypothetical protein
LLKIDAYFAQISRKHPTSLMCLLACLELSIDQKIASLNFFAKKHFSIVKLKQLNP